MALFLALLVALRLAPLLSDRLVYVLGGFAGSLAYVVARRARGNIQANLAYALRRTPRDVQVRRTALECFRNNARNWLDTLRLSSATRADILRRVKVDGFEHLEQALERGTGAVLVGIHLGNIDIVGQTVAARGYHMTVPVEAMRPLALFELVQSLRQRLGLRTVAVPGSGRTLLRALRRNEIAGILCDRNVDRRGVRVSFLGRSAIMNEGPAWLTRHSAAPLLIGFGLRRADGSFDAAISAPLPQSRTADGAEDVRRTTQALAAAVETIIRARPDQWAMFTPVPWESEGSS